MVGGGDVGEGEHVAQEIREGGGEEEFVRAEGTAQSTKEEDVGDDLPGFGRNGDEFVVFAVAAGRGDQWRRRVCYIKGGRAWRLTLGIPNRCRRLDGRSA